MKALVLLLVCATSVQAHVVYNRMFQQTLSSIGGGIQEAQQTIVHNTLLPIDFNETATVDYSNDSQIGLFAASGTSTMNSVFDTENDILSFSSFVTADIQTPIVANLDTIANSRAWVTFTIDEEIPYSLSGTTENEQENLFMLGMDIGKVSLAAGDSIGTGRDDSIEYWNVEANTGPFSASGTLSPGQYVLVTEIYQHATIWDHNGQPEFRTGWKSADVRFQLGVPEPSSAFLICIGLLLLMLSQVKTRRLLRPQQTTRPQKCSA